MESQQPTVPGVAHTQAVPHRQSSDEAVTCENTSTDIGNTSSVGMRDVRRPCRMGFPVKRIGRGMRLSIILGLFARLLGVEGFSVGLII
jgi:hypothetical protein